MKPLVALSLPLLAVCFSMAPLAQDGGPQAPWAYERAFFEGAGHDPAVPTPDSILGHAHASRLSHHAEILACFERWVESSPRIRLQPYGLTHEGRELVYAVITSPANHARLAAIRADLARLHDPRDLGDAEAETLLAGTPPVAWLGYSIHGDETSGADAAVALAYHLVAGTDPAVEELLDTIVVVIDPVMNPDGRERILGMVEQQLGRVTSLDWDSMQRGRWPWGRGNHYLFDMNRDWMAGTQPETRGRWRAVLGFHPQLFVDAHEMESLDTFLFYPQEKPHNPFSPRGHARWQKVYGDAIAGAFDAQGWDYYTREWADGWAPFYSDAWGSLIGGTGLLYEQARTLGTPLRRASGVVLTYREAVHHQAVASLATLEALAANREAVLRDYLASQRRAVAAETPGNERAFVWAPDGHPRREAELLRILREQDVEVLRAREAFTGERVQDRFGSWSDERSFPAGTWIVPARQPMQPLVRAFLDFEARMDKEALLAERTDLERKGTSRVYDVTAWSLPHALDLDACWIDVPEVASEPAGPARPEARVPAFDPATPPVAWIVDGRDDASVAFAMAALEQGLKVHVSDEPFTSGPPQATGSAGAAGAEDTGGSGGRFARGSVVVRRHENGGDARSIDERVRRAAEAARVTVVASASGRSPDDGPDLGGGHFRLLARPRIALLSNAPVAPDAFGHLWHHLDLEVGAPLAILDAQALAGSDLRRYNVLVLPEAWSGLETLLEPLRERLEAWVRGGGTLVACGDAAAALTSGRLGLSQVTLRRDALGELESYRRQAERERGSRAITIDEAAVWGADGEQAAPTDGQVAEGNGDHEAPEASPEVAPEASPGTPEAAPEHEPDEAEREERDHWMRRFAPRGASLRGEVDELAWITAGAGPEMPVRGDGSWVFLARDPVRTAVRLAPAERLRLAGLLWPEARERLADSAWLTVESLGEGQIVLFAAMPAFRGAERATARLFANAVVLGPGLGASQPVGW